MDSELFNIVDRDSAKRNIKRQATKVLSEIASAYDKGLLDDPVHAYTFASLLACICEGKVDGTRDLETGEIKWSLTKEYAAELEKLKAKVFDNDLASHNIVKGPWT